MAISISTTRWSFTSWRRPNVKRMELLDFLVWQREFADTYADSKIHYQGYVEFLKPYSQAQVKRLFADRGMHLEPSEKSREMNIMYCTKAKTYYGERFMCSGRNPEDQYYEFNPFLKLTFT